jgi:hypothetical protein
MNLLSHGHPLGLSVLAQAVEGCQVDPEGVTPVTAAWFASAAVKGICAFIPWQLLISSSPSS